MIPGSLAVSSKKKQGSSLPAGRMLFGGNSGAMAWSDDGIISTSITPFGSGTTSTSIACFCKNSSVVVASVGVGTTASKIYHSFDGINWTLSVDLTSTGYGVSQKIICVNDVFYALMYLGQIYKSNDGVVWEYISGGGFTFPSASETKAALGFCYANGVFMACGSQRNLCTSPDGVTWTQRASGYASNADSIDAVAYSHVSGIWFYFGESYVAGRSYDNGVTWSMTKVISSTSDLGYGAEVNGVMFTGRSNAQHRTATGNFPWTSTARSGTLTSPIYKDSFYYFPSGTGIHKTADFVNWTIPIAGNLSRAAIVL